jgi:hypothetical protein
VEKRRSGSETRQRTAKLNLRLLPSEQRALQMLAAEAGEDVPSSVELRRRSGEHQAALTRSLCTTGPTGSANSRSRAARSAGRCR